MAFYYLADNIFSWSFIATYLIMSLVVWFIMAQFFRINSVRSSLLLTLLAMVFLPFVVTATQGYVALLSVVIIGSLLVQYLLRGFCVSWTEAIALFVLSLAVTGWMTPLM